MPLLVNLRHLERQNVRLAGELPLAELDLDTRDEIIHPHRPLAHDLTVQKLDGSLLVQGTLRLVLDCECARCLRPFEHVIELENWACHVPLEGEDRAAVDGDCVDLTPYVREDILLAFPQNPLCDSECGGLVQPKTPAGDPGGRSAAESASAWAALDKLKL
jgi:uncharacterized protein